MQHLRRPKQRWRPDALEVLRAASLEFKAAAVRYEDRRIGYGARFLAELRSVFEGIERMPLSGAPWLLPGVPTGTRQVPLRTFPHVVVYVTEPRLAVVAVRHGSQAPTYWIDRLEDLE